MTADPTPNLPLLRQILAKIDAEPETWNQEHYGYAKGGTVENPCGTAFCIAGHAAVMTGHPPAWQASLRGPLIAARATDGERIEDIATQALGLTDDEAYKLFNALNDRDRVQDIAEDIAHRAGEAL